MQRVTMNRELWYDCKKKNIFLKFKKKQIIQVHFTRKYYFKISHLIQWDTCHLFEIICEIF